MKSLTLVIIFVILLSYISFAQQPTCDYKVEILVDGNDFEKEDFKWRMRVTKIEGKPTNITGTAEIENSDGKIVKTYRPWTADPISKQKTSNEYSPNLKPDNYKITAEINVECDDTNKDNNADTKTITIKGEKEEIKNKKSKDIETTKNKITNKETTEITQNTIKTKPKTSEPLEETDNIIQLTNKNNQKKQEIQSTTSIIQEPQIVYESSNERAKGWIMIFLLTLSILLNIILIWKR